MITREDHKVLCPVCQSNRTDDLAPYVARQREEDRFFWQRRVFVCGECGTCFTWPMPAEEELRHYYNKTYRADGRNCTADIAKFPLDNLWYLSRGAAIANMTMKYVKANDKVVLRHIDIGAGYGHTIFAMKKAWQGRIICTAVEPDTSCHSSLGKTADVVIPNALEELHIPEGNCAEYDFCTMLHVLEHFRDPVSTLQGLRQILAPHATLLIEVPNCPNARVLSFNNHIPHVPHLYFFEERSLQAVLIRAGLEVLHVSTYGPVLNAHFEYSASFVRTALPIEEEMWCSDHSDGLPQPPYPVFSVAGSDRLFLRAVARKAPE